MKYFLEKYIKEIGAHFLTAGNVAQTNSGVNDNGRVFYAYASFYPQELDLIIQLSRLEDGDCQVVAEIMDQEGKGDEEIFNFVDDWFSLEKELNARRDELIFKVLSRLRQVI